MQLTLHTDYALRVLLYLAHFPERRVGTQEISMAYGISKNHLVRVVQTLADGGYVVVALVGVWCVGGWGGGGGVQLAGDPGTMRLGQIVRKTEASFRLVECHDEVHNTCPIVPVCGLKGMLDSALECFLAELDRYTLGDLVKDPSRERFVQLVS
jgi:Rrf2 family nitric oxide-sensitive transcriptional repressor